MLPNLVLGEGDPRASLAVVGEAPGFYEDKLQRPFVGPSGELVTEMLDAAGVRRCDVWITNVIKYRPPENNLRRLKEIGVDIEEQTEKLWDELNQINPNCILALGGTALKALTGHTKITNYRGSILESKFGYPKVVPTFHPANLLRQQGGEIRDYSAKYYIQFDFKRAVEQSKFKEIERPPRNLSICRDSLSLWKFIKRHEDKDILSVDIESRASIPFCVGLAFSRYEGISIPILDLMAGNNTEGIPAHDMLEIWKMLFDLLASKRIIGQNIKFDQSKLRCQGFQMNVHDDTMLRAHTLWPEFPRNLAFLTSILTEEPYYKDERIDFDPKKDSIKQIYLYNARDACVTLEVFEEQDIILHRNGLVDFHREYVIPLHNFYSEMESVGLLVDMNVRKQLWDKYSELEAKIEEELATLIGSEDPVNVNSPKQVAELLYQKLKLPVRKEFDKERGVWKLKTDEDTIIALYSNHAKDAHTKRILKLIMTGRQTKKSKSTYIKALPDFDGRMRTSYNIVGTDTGRTSTNIIGPPLRPIKMGLAFQTITKYGDVGSDIRSMFIPDPGYVFLEVDLSQAEDRVVAHLAGDELAFEQWRLGQDRHKYTASIVFEIDIDSVSGDHRQIGKKVRHAGNYDMQKRKLMQVLTSESFRFNIDIVVSEWKAGVLLDRFHNANPKIRGEFHKGVRDALANRQLTNPFGRVRTFLDRWDEDLFRKAYAHIPQSTVSDHNKFSGVRIKRILQGLRICSESHDSLTCLVKPNDIKEVTRVMKQELEKPIDFSRCSLPRGGELIIPCEFKIGEKNLKDMTNYVVH